MWNVYQKMTRRSDSNYVLPLINDDSSPIFDQSMKCSLLQSVFFDCYQKDNNQFDRSFYDQIMSSYTDIIFTLNTEDDEELYNRDITLEEVEGAISRLKRGKAP